MFKAMTVAFAVGFALATGELIARYRVRRVWSAEMRHTMLADGARTGRYIHHAELGYLPRPDYDDHNSSGFRGEELEATKPPGRLRVVCLGGSTTYGPSAQTAYPAILENLLRQRGVDVEVVNAGVPGWTSRESRLNFERRIEPLDPDLVIVYHGRNDLIPQAYNNFRDDYSHFRDSAFDFRGVADSRASLKKWFRLSNLFMLATRASSGISGFDEAAEHPIFAAVRTENRPEPSEVLTNLAGTDRGLAFRNNTEAIIERAMRSGARVMLATFAFLPEKFKTSHFLTNDPVIHVPLAEQVAQNNNVLRELASEHDVLLANTEVLSEHPYLFDDDCHVNAKGHVMRARILLDTLQAGGVFASESTVNRPVPE